MPDGEFPTEEWLRKRGKWANRDGPPYNTMSVYIKTWLGGIRNLRKLLGQAHASTASWNREAAIAAYQNFYKTHGVTPDQARHFRRTKERPFSDAIMKDAARICFAVSKYAGGTAAVNRLLEIAVTRKRKWTRGTIIDGYRQVVNKWGASPVQVLYAHRMGQHILADDDRRSLAQMVGAASREFGGSKPVLELIGFVPRSRGWRNRRSPTQD